MITPTYERVHELLDYNTETGLFYWKIVRNSYSDIGREAGCRKGPDGMVQLRIDGRSYKSHRIVWLWMTGNYPTLEIDHIDGNRQNNSWSNLREVSRSVNQQNLKNPLSTNKSGFLGVRNRRGRSFAEIRIEGDLIRSTCYTTPEQAHKEYVRLKRIYHPGCTL